MNATMQADAFIETIMSEDAEIRDRSLESLCEGKSLAHLMKHAEGVGSVSAEREQFVSARSRVVFSLVDVSISHPRTL